MADDLRWGVVGTMDEPAPLVLAWAAHYLSLGAAEVHIFLDRPVPEVTRQLARLPQCFVTVCDEAYWAASSRGKRPKRHTGRQKFNATSVYRRGGLDWLLHCDADEFLYPVGPFLEELHESRARSIRIPNVERVRRGAEETLFEGTFRLRCEEEERLAEAYGSWASYLKGGFSGYMQGKDIVRGGQALEMGIHFPIDMATGKACGQPQQTSEAAVLLHFDGLTPLHVLTKLLKRAHEPNYKTPRQHGDQRVLQFTYAKRNAGRPGQLWRLLDNVFSLDTSRARALGPYHLSLGFDPAPALAAHGLSADLSAAAFDTELRQREAELHARAGLSF